jgi:uncharacterized protein with von Willebrand factor type A (vWA) domain
VSTTTVLELVAVAAGVVTFVVWLRRLGLRVSPWDAVIAEHVEATGRYPTVAEWRSGRVGRDANRPEPTPAGPVTVTVTAVDGKPVAGAR